MTRLTHAASLSPLPVWLTRPAAQIVTPPVETRLQSLPYEKLSWPDFERLCLRLAQRDAAVEGCRQYGEQGDDQAGIDLYAREINGGQYVVYQCKRVKDFGPSKIKNAIDKFLTEDGFGGHDRVSSFVLCTMESLRSKARDDMFRKQEEILLERQIRLLRWDEDELNAQLKKAPELVDDFFGRSWVVAFCGEEAAAALGDRLDAPDYFHLRQQLRKFYTHIFQINDSGVALADVSRVGAPMLHERFIFPDIIDSPEEIHSIEHKSDTELDDLEFESTFSLGRRRRREIRRIRTSPKIQRRSLEGWLSEHDAHVILGGPGSGKSSALRFLALDLLSEAPALEQLAIKWGDRIPIWVPFAFWTRRISFENEQTVSLHEVMQEWLRASSNLELIPLITRALTDNRLILIVDGLDEYVRADWGELALDRLTVFMQQRGVPVLLSSRPDGYKFFRARLGGWSTAHIAEFSHSQQLQLAEIWIGHQLRHINEDLSYEALQSRTKVQAEAFLSELNDSPDLTQLAGIPLLLCLLIALHRAESALPRNRFRAFDEIVKHLLETHPQRRRRAAALSDDVAPLSYSETRQSLERLAYEMHCSYPEGVIPIEAAAQIVAGFLCDGEIGMGLSRREAQTTATQLVSVGDTHSGLLVGRSPNEAGFFHRSLQEFLAAGHIARMNNPVVVVEERRLDPQWREVLLGTLHYAKQPRLVRDLIEAVRAPGGTVPERQHLDQLLAEAAFGEFQLPPALAQDIARHILMAIERENWIPQRDRLLNHALEGLRSAKVRELVQERLKIWFPERVQYRSSVIDAIANWPAEEDTISILVRGLFEEGVSERVAAAESLGALGRKGADISETLLQIIRQAQSVEAQGAALYALILSKAESGKILDLSEGFSRSIHPEHRLIAYLGLAAYGHLTDEHLDDALMFLDPVDGVSYAFKFLVVDILVQGWPKNERLKKACLPSASRKYIDASSSWQILLRAFPSDPDVISSVENEIRYSKYPFMSGSQEWPLLLENFQGVPAIDKAVDWRVEKGDLDVRSLYFASLITKSDIAKQKLLSSLGATNYHWVAQALVEGWGMDDTEVSVPLLNLVNGSDESAAQIGFLIPAIMRDEEAARDRLINLLNDAVCSRPDFVVNGLSKVGVGSRKPEVVEAVLLHLRRPYNLGHNGPSHAFRLLANESKIVEYAKEVVQSGGPLTSAVAYYLGQNIEIRNLVRERVMPLDAGARFIIASKLRQRRGELTLLKADCESDPDTRVQAAISLAARTQAEGLEYEPVIQHFIEAIESSRIGSFADIQAGIAGLLTLGSLETLKLKVRDKEIFKWIPSALATSFESSGIFASIVMRYWDEIEQVLGISLLEPDEKGKYPIEIVETIAKDAIQFPKIAQKILYVLEQDPMCWHSAGNLDFLGRVVPGSGLLMQACFENLSETASINSDTLIKAAQLIGKHFRYNDVALETILSLDSTVPPQEKVLTVLLEAWPNHTVTKAAFDWYKLNKAEASFSLHFRLVSRFSNSEVLIDSLMTTFRECEKEPRIASMNFVQPLIRRLREDDETAVLFIEWMKSTDNPSAISTSSRLLSLAGRLNGQALDWCKEKIELLSYAGADAPLGIDLVSGRVRPLLHSLLDAI